MIPVPVIVATNYRKVQFIDTPRKYVSKTRRLFTQKDLDYLVDNHQTSTIAEIAKNLSLSVSALRFQCIKYDIHPIKGKRVKRETKNQLRLSKEKIAGIIEDYISTGDPIGEIAKRNKTTGYMVNKCLSNLYFGKRLSEETEIITLQSKI